MPAAAVWERQAALVSGACRLSLREVECSAQAIEATETAALQRGLLLFASELKVASATLGDGGRSVRLADSDGRALLGAVSPMVELVVQQCTNPAGCRIGAALPGKGALSSSLGTDAESWGYTADGRIFNKGSSVQSGLPTYKAGDRIRMTLTGGVLAWHINGQRAAETLRLGEWVMPVGELRSGESVSMGGQAVGEAEGAVVGALLKASTSLTTLDLSGSSCAAEAARLIGEGLRESAAPLAELRLGGLIHAEGAVSVAARLAALVRGACRPSLRLIDCTKQAGGKAGVCALFAAEGEGVVASLAALMSTAGNALATVRLGGNGPWAEGDGRREFASALGAASCVVAELDVGGYGLGVTEALALVSSGRALQTLRLGEWAMPVGELRSGESVSTGGQAVGEADGAVVGALLRASTSLTTLDLSGSSCAAEAARLIGEGLRESAAPLAELWLANVWYTTDGRMPAAAVWERQAALVSGACRLSLREVECSAQAIGVTETAALQRGLLLFAPELKVASATLGDGGRSVRLAGSDGRALLGAVSPMVELVVQQCTDPAGCRIGAAPPGKGALSSSLGSDAESWGYTADGKIRRNGSDVQSGLPTYKAGDRIRMTLTGGVLAWHINGQRAAEVRGVPSGVHLGVGRWLGTVEVRIERAVVAGAAGCSAMLRPLCGLMGREGNALR
ncbi:hypothetical protein Ctob_016651, partial [Chrysochromulina tobinii]